MKTMILNSKLNWRIAYSPYVDVLHLYLDKLNSKKDDELRREEDQDLTLVYDRNNEEALLLELKDASQYLGKIDNMANKDIIKAIEVYINGK